MWLSEEVRVSVSYQNLMGVLFQNIILIPWEQGEA